MMGHPATLKKISTRLNLSISTVSRALKDHPDISENTRRKVKELAALMEYEPNSYAVNLRLNKSHIFGLIVPAVSNMFYDSFIAAVEEGARQQGYVLMILQSGDDPRQEAENLKLCKQNRVDGLFISLTPGGAVPALFEKFRESGSPVIFFDKVPQSGAFDSICLADEEAATLAADTIRRYKKKNILALFGDPQHSITIKRKEAFLKTLGDEKRIKTKTQHCRNSDEARLACETVLLANPRHRPDHIFCMSDELLVGAMKAIHRAGLIIPDDISVLAISNGFLPGIFNPEITYIETSGYELGKLAIRRMLEKIAGEKEPRSIFLPSRLVEGHSMK